MSHEPLHLRAADADRDRTADFLGRRCAEGRLNPEELSERLERVYAALTYGERAAVVSDLPADPPRQNSRGRRRGARTLTVSAATVCAILLVGLPVYGLTEALAASPVATVSLLVVLAVLAALTVAMLASLLVAVAPVAAVALGAVWLGRHLERRRDGGRTR
ncbi:MAG TPA: DUF1707 domain-containing protein [Thermoleophilaceae bacterium]|nr:DUF1707 domain-containing protein [Thermoleophilaceae bacterium]